MNIILKLVTFKTLIIKFKIFKALVLIILQNTIFMTRLIPIV